MDYITYGRRTKWDDIGFFQYGYEWKEGASQILATAKTTFFPAVIFCTLLQTAFGIVMGASGQAVSFALLAAGFVIPTISSDQYKDETTIANLKLMTEYRSS